MRFTKKLAIDMGLIEPGSQNRKAGGLEAKRQGAAFESRMIVMAKANGIQIVRLPDGCKQVGPTRLIRVKSPFDFLMSHNGRMAAIDTKSTKTKSVAVASIPSHQVDAMKRVAGSATAGFVVWFREQDSVEFFSIGYAVESERLRVGEGMKLGSGSDFNLAAIFVKPELSSI